MMFQTQLDKVQRLTEQWVNGTACHVHIVLERVQKGLTTE
jgi:hypothetical protein